MDFFTIAAPCEGSIIEKRSEFIAQLFPVTSADDFASIFEEIRKKHNKARHNVWAYRLRDAGGAQRYSDDGEPQGTGGVPVLGVLQKNELTDVCCIVTRYFGGVLLGASGLTRAYSSAAALAVQNAQIQHFCEAEHIRLRMDYGLYGKVSFLLPEYDILDRGSSFEDAVILEFDVKSELFPALEQRLTDVFSGNPPIERIETHFADFGK